MSELAGASSVAPVAPAERGSRRRLRFDFTGRVQGVGFRPCVSRLADSQGLSGWVGNTADGASVEIEGGTQALEVFLQRLRQALPAVASLDEVRVSELGVTDRSPPDHRGFEILNSQAATSGRASVMPDIATCSDCLADIFDANSRWYRYPFTTCSHCGPRYSIVRDLPYDRSRTTMAEFPMCAACERAYGSADDRRYHAQSIACPECGPRLTAYDAKGAMLGTENRALTLVADALRRGAIVALKGIGGYQLLVDARDEKAVLRLRRRKNRPDKPFALLGGSLGQINTYCHVSRCERELLSGSAAPIVLLQARSAPVDKAVPLASGVAPASPELGFMLPCSALHHLLAGDLNFPIVATSGNVAGAPILTEDLSARNELAAIADLFLTNDRAIACPADDSVARVMAGRELILRRGRGLAPLSLALEPRPTRPSTPADCVLAMGGQEKSAPALLTADRVILAGHVGDLDDVRAREAHDAAVVHLSRLHGQSPNLLVRDAHPDFYRSATTAGRPVRILSVQHHVAHVLACMADNKLDGPVLGVAWDGSGYGDDGSFWGGEFIAVDGLDARRVASFRSFPLPGGNAAAREPLRSALGLLFELRGPAALEMDGVDIVRQLSRSRRRLFGQMLSAGLNSPRTSSVGRLIDAVASLLGLARNSTFQGQAAMSLEYAARRAPIDPDPKRYAFDYSGGNGDSDEPMILDWAGAVTAIIEDMESGVDTTVIAANFQAALVEAVATVAQLAGRHRLVLSGGCFQNKYLTEASVKRIRQLGLQAYWHHKVPPNDGGLALGQAVWAARVLDRERA